MFALQAPKQPSRFMPTKLNSLFINGMNLKSAGLANA
jgi:hypothetical protein